MKSGPKKLEKVSTTDFISMQLLWKLSMVLVLSESYTKLRRLGLGSSADAVILQVNFHTLFVLSTIGQSYSNLFIQFYV